MSGVWSHKFDYHQHHNHALYAYLHVNTCVITFLYEEEKKREFIMCEAETEFSFCLYSFIFFLRFRFIYRSEQNDCAKVCKVMTRSCTFQTAVYVYASNIEYREEKKEKKGTRKNEAERERQSNHYHTVDCHAKVRRTIIKRKRL
jgi:hypothetical protein